MNSVQLNNILICTAPIHINDKTEKEAHISCWTTPRQPAVEGWHAAKYVIIGQSWRGPRENQGVRYCWSKCTHWLNINFSDFQESYTVQSVPPTCFMISLYLRITSAVSFKCYFTSPVLAPGMHFSMFACVANVTVIKIELPIRHFVIG